MSDVKMFARPWEPQDLLDDLQLMIDEQPDGYLNHERDILCMARAYLEEYFAEKECAATVGKTVYALYNRMEYSFRNGKNRQRNSIIRSQYELDLCKNHNAVEIREKTYVKTDVTFFGLSIFLTREQAEKAVEGQNDG